MSELEALQMRYFELLERQQLDPADLDYAKLESARPMLEQLAAIKNSGVSVFDMHSREHVFASYNFESLFGYDYSRIESEGTAYFDSRIHPEDYPALIERGIATLEFFYSLPVSERPDFKAITEYRILTHDATYIRIVEQHQPLELDLQGNVWLTLSVLDISPRQGIDIGVQSTLVNFKTGQVADIPKAAFPQATEKAKLTSREREVLSLIQQGHLSKEISGLLSISVHTVNTHRQRILEKLEVGNSMEAVKMASRLGLLD
ncbi:MAG: hypothetical protein RLZZ519_3092 [Bacteroidota bacterium]|jgi:DNA-binding CsgD family transcriptional regulator